MKQEVKEIPFNGSALLEMKKLKTEIAQLEFCLQLQ